MGYAIFEDQNAASLGVKRWAGYEVPGICDMPDCTAEIDRGMDNRCERVWTTRYLADGEEVESDDEWDEEIETEDEGCHLFFCAAHLNHHEDHGDATPKPDTEQWRDHILTDPSWAQWRAENGVAA